MGKPKIFLDSSVIVTALLSARGGSSYILREKHERFVFCINEYVFAEIQELLLSDKFARYSQLASDLFLLLGVIEIRTVANPAPRELTSIKNIISQKDAPILASALKYADHLLTLDNEFFKPSIVALATKQSVTISKPGDLIGSFDL